MWFWDNSGISWTICKQFARRCRQITTPIPHQSSRNFYSPIALPDAQPTMSNGSEWKCSKDTVICSRVLNSKIKRAAEFCRPTRCRSATVCDLGVFIDQDLTTKTHVQQTTSRCFATLRQLRSIRSLNTDVRLPFPCFCTRLQQVGLLQQSPDRLASHLHPASPFSPKCRSKAHFQPWTL